MVTRSMPATAFGVGGASARADDTMAVWMIGAAAAAFPTALRISRRLRLGLGGSLITDTPDCLAGRDWGQAPFQFDLAERPCAPVAEEPRCTWVFHPRLSRLGRAEDRRNGIDVF